MHQNQEKSDESRKNAPSAAQKVPTSIQSLGFVDNRSGSVQMQKLQEVANNSLPNKQPKQLQEIIDNSVPQQEAVSRQTQNNSVIQNYVEGDNIEAKFTKSPGNQVAKWHDVIFGGDFDVKAQFNPDHTEGGDWGEYRQYVKGTVKKNGETLEHELSTGVQMAADSFKEDGDGETRYGHRGKYGDGGVGNKYTNLNEKGSKYECHDSPGFDNGYGYLDDSDSVEVDMYFKGELIDTKSPNAPLASKQWSVKGADEAD